MRKAVIDTSKGFKEVIIKVLHEHSKREINVYRFLSNYPNFPIPKVYYSELDGNTETYVLITEFCDAIGDWPFKEPEITSCGILLARIHSFFWNDVKRLIEGLDYRDRNKLNR